MNKNPQLFNSLFVLVTESDERLMSFVKAHNKSAFEKLYERYKQKIFNFILNMLNDQAKAEDLTQEVFLKVYKNAEKFSEDAKFSTWIYTIAKNTTIDYIRKKKDVLVGQSEDGSEWLENQIDEEQNIEMQVILKSDIEILQKCIEKLVINQREALCLRVFSDFSYEEIAKVLNKSTSSIKSLINRSKVSLSQCVKSCQELSDG